MTPDSYDIKSKIGVIFQDVAVFDELNVYDNIDYFCGLYISDKNKRREYVEEHLSKAEEATKKAEDNVKETEKKLALSNKKALQIIEDAKKEAEIQKQEILLQAKVEANNKMIQVQQDIEKEKQKAVQEVHDDVVNLALEASKTLLTREVNSLDNQKLLNDFVDELTEEK